jgi:hypothetical protein
MTDPRLVRAWSEWEEGSANFGSTTPRAPVNSLACALTVEGLVVVNLRV